jgi:4-amino-4-deoxy-L-arabinose transferase-like glycosyltransferase
MAGGLLHAIGIPAESSARIVSLLASILTAALVVAMAYRYGRWPAAAAAAALIAFEPVLLRLSYAIITEPLYSFVVLLGLWLLLRQSDARPTPRSAVALGVVFGAAFLCRLEGILFLAVVPALRWIASFMHHRGEFSRQLHPLASWTAVFVAVFVAVAAPHVAFVSSKMNQFALNGRQAWSAIMSAPGDQHYYQRIYGLDFNPTAVNIDHLRAHPEDLATVATTVSLKERATLVAKNLSILQRDSLPTLLGLPVFALMLFGLAYLLRSARATDAVIVAGFLAVGYVAPLLHNTVPRHILVSAGPLLLLASLGVVGVAREFAERLQPSTLSRYALPASVATVLGVTLALNAWPLWQQLRVPDASNPDSDRRLLEPFIEILGTACKQDPDTVVVARLRYLPLYAGCESISMPYASLEQLHQYAKSNNATFVFVDSRSDATWPFYADLTRPVTPPAGFERVASQVYPDGLHQFLYRVEARNSPEDAHGEN